MGTVRPHVLAGIFAAYFTLVMVAAWTFASRVPAPVYGPEISRWAYTAYLLASAIFLVGLGLLAFQVRESFERRVRELNRQLGSLFWDWEPPTATPVNSVFRPSSEDRDLDEILETVGEAQTHEVHEVLMRSSIANAREDAPIKFPRATMAQPELLRRREIITHHAVFLMKFLPGPAAVAVGILGISAAMLPATDAMLQTFHQLNTALVLGIACSWVGLAAYFGASVLGVARSLPTERKGRTPRERQ